MTDSRSRKLVNMKFPAGFAHAYAKTDPVTGEVKEKAILTFPEGMRAEGHDLSRWYLVAFRTPRMNRQIEAGDPVVLSVRAWREDGEGKLTENTLRAFRGSGKDAEWIDLNPWSVACGLRDLRSRTELATSEARKRPNGDDNAAASGASSSNDSGQARMGGRTTPPSQKKKAVDDSFAGRIKRMRQAAAAQEHAR